MQHKLIMTWDITQGKEQEYFDFLIHTFGDEPQVMVTAILPDELEAERRMSQNDWHVLIDQLEDHVDNLEMKLVPARDTFQF